MSQIDSAGEVRKKMSAKSMKTALKGTNIEEIEKNVGNDPPVQGHHRIFRHSTFRKEDRAPSVKQRCLIQSSRDRAGADETWSRRLRGDFSVDREDDRIRSSI